MHARFELRESIRSMKEDKLQLAHEIKPSRPALGWDEKVDINGVSGEAEKNDCVASDEKAGEIFPCRGSEDDGKGVLHEQSDLDETSTDNLCRASGLSPLGC
jgi:hypothetical protein